MGCYTVNLKQNIKIKQTFGFLAKSQKLCKTNPKAEFKT